MVYSSAFPTPRASETYWLRLAEISANPGGLSASGSQVSVITQFDGPLIEFGDGEQSHRRA
jgi:hypothetical protein